jgi:hypothetical protein
MARIIVILVSALVFLGCTQTDSSVVSIGGDYFLESVVVQNITMHSPGGYTRLYYRNGRRKIEVARDVGGYGGTTNLQFEWRVYGSNLVYVARKPGGSTLDRAIYVFSRRGGTNVMTDPDVYRYWRTSADASGITLHRYQHGEAVEDPQPVRYTADYLAGL